MSQPCSVFGCDSNHAPGRRSYATFSLPPNEIIRKLWLRHIPSYIKNPVVCIKHFSEASISRTETVLVDRELMVFQRTNPKLKPGAVPTIFPEGSGYVRNSQAVIEPYPIPESSSSGRRWQGGGPNVVMAPGTPGVSGNSIDLPPNPNVPNTLLASQQMRGPPINGFMPLSDQIRARSNHYVNLYNYNPKLMNINPSSTTPPMLPTPAMHPEVRYKRLSFYDVLGELMKPTTLVSNNSSREPTASFSFYLTPKQASDISLNREVGPGTRNEYIIQVQLRFCALDTSAEQEDSFPPGCAIKVNGKLVPLPNPVPPTKQGAEPKRPSRPINVSHVVKISPSVSNNLLVSWNPDYQRAYVVTILLVKKLTPDDLLERLKGKGVRHADYTTGLIKDKLSDSDNDIATTEVRISLRCPLGKGRMVTPCRASTCSHLQCFDAGIFISMNEKRPTWTCPVCNKHAPYEILVIDGYFQEVLESPLLGDSLEIELNKDGSWSPIDESKEPAASLAPSKDQALSLDSPKPEIQEIKDDDDDEPAATTVNGNSGKVAAPEKTGEAVKDVVIVDLTEDDSDGEDAPRPPPAAAIQETLPPPVAAPPISSKQMEHVLSDSSSNLSTTRSPPSIINLDSPSPSPPLPNYSLPSSGVVSSPPSNYMCHMRLAPDSRYHPY